MTNKRFAFRMAAALAFLTLSVSAIPADESAPTANQPGTPVHLSYRGEDFARAKERNRDKLEAAVRAGKVTLLLKSQVREIRPDLVILDADGEAMILPNDDVIVRIGGDAPYTFLQQLGIRIVQKDVPLAPERAQAG